MGTITSAGSGNWGTGATWVGGSVPANGDAVVIADGHAIVFNVDQSGFAAGIAGLTLGAGSTLTASTSAGAYYLKMAGNITASGAGAELRAGTAETAYPTNCTFTIYMNGNFSIDGGASNTLTCKFYCYDPPVKYLRLISATPKAITGISKANPCTVTCVGHGKSGGDIIYLVDVGGMVELNNLRVKVKTVLTADTFTLRHYDGDVVVDSTNFTAYTSGGYVCPETAEAVGQTQLEIDTDVSADAEWTRSGATVVISNVARAKDVRTRTISSVASGSVTISVGLAEAKHSSALVILTSRNVMIKSSSTSIATGHVYRGSGHVLNCASSSANTGNIFCSGVTNTIFDGVCAGLGFSYGSLNDIGGVICNGTNVVSSSNSTIRGLIASGTNALIYGSANKISATFSGCGTVVAYGGSGNVFTGEAVGCSTGFNAPGAIILDGGLVKGCTWAGTVPNYSTNTRFVGNYQVFTDGYGVLRNCLLSGTVEYAGYNSAGVPESCYTESYDHNKIAGAFRSWTRGGIVSSTETDPPTGRVRSYQHVCESATYPCWHQRKIVVDAGRQLRFRVWLKADAGVEIKAQLVLPTADPLITGTGTGEWQQIGTSDGTWHEYVTSWTNSATYPVTIYARVLSTAESGNGYSDMMWAFDRTPLVR